MQCREKIGILGGTFNPIHMGHLILAQNALETYALSRIVFIPAAQPPHKEARSLLDAHHRLCMVHAAIEDHPAFEVSDIEITRTGASYAVDTVSALQESNPDSDLFFIIGSDTLKELHSWKSIYTLLALCTFVTFDRAIQRVASLQPSDLHLDAPWPKRLLQHVTPSRLIQISSTDIRYRIAEGLRICYLVPKRVEDYILKHNLYGSAQHE